MAAAASDHYNNNLHELYRGTSIGIALTDALDDLISMNVIEPQLAMKILNTFDREIMNVIGDKAKDKISFKGSLETYRSCDDVWTLLVKDVTLKLEGQKTMHSNEVKIVSMPNKRASD